MYVPQCLQQGIESVMATSFPITAVIKLLVTGNKTVKLAQIKDQLFDNQRQNSLIYSTLNVFLSRFPVINIGGTTC